MAIPIESVNALSISSVSETQVSSTAAWGGGVEKDHTLTLKNTGSVDVHLAATGVSTSSAALEPGERVTIHVRGGQIWYGLAASGTGTLRVWRN